jgi:hypothetical protein
MRRSQPNSTAENLSYPPLVRGGTGRRAPSHDDLIHAIALLAFWVQLKKVEEKTPDEAQAPTFSSPARRCLFITFPVIPKRRYFPSLKRLLSPPPLGGGGRRSSFDAANFSVEIFRHDTILIHSIHTGRIRCGALFCWV